MAQTFDEFFERSGFGKLVLTRHVMQRLRQRTGHFVRRTEARQALLRARKLTPDQAGLLTRGRALAEGSAGVWHFLVQVKGRPLVAVLRSRKWRLGWVTALPARAPLPGMTVPMILRYRGTRREKAKLERRAARQTAGANGAVLFDGALAG